MTSTKRPRVAAIGLSDAQIASIESLCGELRLAYSLLEYLQSYSWTETDVMVAGGNLNAQVDCSVNLMIIGPHLISMVGQARYACRGSDPLHGNNQ